MADVIENQVVEQPDMVIPEGKAELDALMSRNLGIGMPPSQQSQQVQQPITQEPVVTEPIANEPVVVPEFKFDTFKTEFGYEKPEDMVADIKQLRTLKNTPPTPAELKFENEQSKLLFDAIKAGKTTDVYNYLEEQHRLEKLTSMEVTAQTAADIIKAGFQMKYKGLTPELIEHKFNKTFGIPPEPRIREEEEQEDFDARKAEWAEKKKDIELDRILEAQIIKPELEAAKAKLVLPEIAQTVDQEFLDWKKEQEEMKITNAQVFEAYKAFKNEDVKYEQDFIDEANKINAKMEYIPSADAFKKAQECVTDIDKFFAMYKNSDGSPNRKGFMQDIALLIDKKAFVAAAMNQAKNATIKASLPDNSGNNGNQRQVTNIVEKSELDKEMERRGITRAN